MKKYSFTFWFYEKKNLATGAFEDPIVISLIDESYEEAVKRAKEIAEKNNTIKNQVFLQNCTELLKRDYE